MSADKYYKVPEWQLRDFIRADNENTWHNHLEEYGEECMSHFCICRELDDEEVTQRLSEFEEISDE